MSTINVGQFWEHDDGQFSVQILQVDEVNEEVCIRYSEGKQEWVGMEYIYEEFSLPEEEHHCVSQETTVDDAEAAFLKATGQTQTIDPLAQELQKEAENLSAQSMSDFDAAEAAFNQATDSPLAQVKAPTFDNAMANLLVLGII